MTMEMATAAAMEMVTAAAMAVAANKGCASICLSHCLLIGAG
jgi:hypothetical protein